MGALTSGRIDFDLRSHLASLRWIGRVFVRPKDLEVHLKALPESGQVASIATVYLHTWPYVLLLSAIVRWLIYGHVGTPIAPAYEPISSSIIGSKIPFFWVNVEILAIAHAAGLGIGVVFTLASRLSLRGRLSVSLIGGSFIGFLFGLLHGGPMVVLIGILGGVAFSFLAGLIGLSTGIVLSFTVALSLSITGAIDFTPFGGLMVGTGGGVVFGLVNSIAVRQSGAGRVGIVIGPVIGVLGALFFGLVYELIEVVVVGFAFYFLSFFFVYFRVFYYVIHPLWLWRKNPNDYPLHPVAWDDICLLPFPRLHELLVDYANVDRESAEREIDRLIDEYPSQRKAGLWARAILTARDSADTSNLGWLDELLASLPEGDEGFLTQTGEIREMAHEIAFLQTRLDTDERQFLREPLARLLCREIQLFRSRIAGFQQPLARELRIAASNWLELARQQLENAEAVLKKEPTHAVFLAGDPVDREREAFVPRNTVSIEIERQVMLATGCPGIVLYGRRRTGKSTVLRNLDGFLPRHVVRASISMQKPGAFSSLADLIATLTKALDDAVDGLKLITDDNVLQQLFHNLDMANEALEAAGRRLLLSIDEYENLDRKVGEGILPEDLLATLRESIQTHRRITWIFAGSHEITELPNARWTSYLVSTRTVEVEPFTSAETRLLLTEPLKHSKLWPKDDPNRPFFEPGFWGEGGIERIHAETGGWPHLVQLVAETVVDLLKNHERSSADIKLLERALDKAIVRGHNVLYELIRAESILPGEWDYLNGFRRHSTQPPPSVENIARSLRRRLLVTEDDGVWRLRVPLAERWLRQRG